MATVPPPWVRHWPVKGNTSAKILSRNIYVNLSPFAYHIYPFLANTYPFLANTHCFIKRDLTARFPRARAKLSGGARLWINGV